MTQQTFLTGITTTGTPHLGNYVGAIYPAIKASRNVGQKGYFFLADYHALVKSRDAQRVRQSRFDIAATWLALGLDTGNAVFYRQSDVPEVMELTWILACMAGKGLLNRAHAYKAMVQENLDSGTSDPDKAVTMGLFNYPLLMAADILLYKATHVPVGRDQVQHVEMTRDIAQRFNHHYGELLVLPEAVVDEHSAVLTGLDGRKMSKSYDNTIPLFESAKKLRKSVMKIVTNSQRPGEPKDPAGNTLFDIYQAFASAEQTAGLRTAFAEGIAWGEAKQQLYELLEATLAEPRERYLELVANPQQVEDELRAGAEQARAVCRPFIAELRLAVGLA